MYSISRTWTALDSLICMGNGSSIPRWHARGGTEYEADIRGIVIKSLNRCINAVSLHTFIKHQINTECMDVSYHLQLRGTSRNSYFEADRRSCYRTKPIAAAAVSLFNPDGLAVSRFSGIESPGSRCQHSAAGVVSGAPPHKVPIMHHICRPVCRRGYPCIWIWIGICILIFLMISANQTSLIVTCSLCGFPHFSVPRPV